MRDAAPTWAQDGMPDFVDQTEPTDRDPDSIGCGLAFISWLISLEQPLSAIAQGMVALGDSGTLAELFQQLTAQPAADAWPNFTAAVQALPSGVTRDDPFG
jgi:hypothetical protein